MAIKCPKCDTDNPDTQKFCGECATPLPSSKEIPVTETLETPTEELTRGTTFTGRYQIIEELGEGGMGRVYKAHDTEKEEKFALKLIKHFVATDKKQKGQIEKIEHQDEELRNPKYRISVPPSSKDV